MNIAFMVSTMPEPSETFILDQARVLALRGHRLDVYADYVHPPLGHCSALDMPGAPARVYSRRPAFHRRRWRWRLNRLAQACSQLGTCPGLVWRAMNVLAFGRSAATLDLLEMALYFRDRPAYDIVHCHFGPNGVYAAMLSDLGVLRGKLVTSFHGFDVTVLPRRFGHGYYRHLFATGHLFTCNSAFMARRLERLGCPRDRLVVLPVGVDVQGMPSRPAPHGGDESLELLTVARLVEVKGVEYGLRCVSRVAAEFPQLRYTIVGEGPLMADLQRLCGDLGLQKRVRFTGSMDHREVRDLYQQADVFLLPSVVAGDGAEEAQGLALLEAQAAGVPVISSPVGGIPDSVADGESGFLVPQRDVEAMAARLRELLAQPDLRTQMGRAGRTLVARHFDLGVQATRLAELYREVRDESAPDSTLPAQAG